MKLPGLQVHVQPLVEHLVSVPFIALPVHHVNEQGCAALQVGPGQVDAPLAPRVRKIDDHKVFLVASAPAPRDEVDVARVVRPTASLAEAPLSLLEGRATDDLDQSSVKGQEILVDRLLRPPAELHRELDPPPVK